ncbi:sugar kinase [Actibacterium sp. 188UL27-1]|uniref:sugar kinase n=1 Tax=Actibacterium sp. 188UL27-1 TaxID=2786961 RepID=UPI0019561BE9|nr:sugar kinase [Actibacterium sp. 188UL27-1]MBM7067846.1 sugar kinase [Actibacterium sp. 188UL27-1]
MQKVIMGLGECMVELSPDGPGLFRQSFAGDVLNTLWYACRALDPDWRSELLSAVGTDALSDQMIGFLTDAGIACDAVRRIPDRRPGLYMIQLDEGERSFTYWRDRSAARLLAADPDHLKRHMARAGLIYFSGITLAILPEEDVETLLSSLKIARARGALIAFDTNLRLALWPDPARMPVLMAQAAAISDLVFPSFDDEQAGFDDAIPAQTIDRYLGYGASTVILKNGAAAVQTSTGRGVQHHPTAPVPQLIDSTGAGDSFNGAFLAEYVRSIDIVRSVQAGQCCAAEVVQHRGALIR